MTKSLLLSFAALAALSAPAAAQQYVSGSVGLNMQTDSDNEGAFSRDFVTGDGVAVPPGAVLPAGTASAGRPSLIPACSSPPHTAIA